MFSRDCQQLDGLAIYLQEENHSRALLTGPFHGPPNIVNQGKQSLMLALQEDVVCLGDLTIFGAVCRSLTAETAPAHKFLRCDYISLHILNILIEPLIPGQHVLGQTIDSSVHSNNDFYLQPPWE